MNGFEQFSQSQFDQNNANSWAFPEYVWTQDTLGVNAFSVVTKNLTNIYLMEMLRLSKQNFSVNFSRGC